MRLKKGSNVEVFHSTKTLPNGSWRPATILSGNGHKYTVQYDLSSLSHAKVARKFIRPSPPMKENSKPINWACGDLAEVFIHGGWTNGKLTGVTYGNEFYFILLIDQCREIAVRRNNLRLRHVWQNNQWILIKKDAERKDDTKKRKSAAIIVHEGNSESTGSCSTSGRLYNYTSFQWENDDAMSSFPSAKKAKTCRDMEINDDVESKRETHQLELHEYILTMHELYESGRRFITWEEEEMLADLRLSLNISHDEHWSVLKSLGP